MSGGNVSTRLSVNEFGEFAMEIPLSELKKIESVDDLLPDESAGNGTEEEVSDSKAMWSPSQARTLLENIVGSAENWGPVTETNLKWNIENIK